ncbi:MAG: NigD-like protein [Tannerellaceae bacterium]|nr:NigD-like protein [Tannerellaceae bacterium]
MLKLFYLMAGLALSSLTFNSCLDDNAYSLGNIWLSIATARPVNDGAFYLMLDDSTTLWPGAPLYINYQPARPQRVQINYTKLGDHFENYDYVIKLNAIDTILTKTISENFGQKNDSIYGTDPVEITAMWIGDGFLNIEFKAYFGGSKHFVNLIPATTDNEDPYKLEFRHNALDDKSSYLRYGFVAFDLSDLPDTAGKDVTLRIKTNTFEGIKEFEKKYNSGKNTEQEKKLWSKKFEKIM